MKQIDLFEIEGTHDLVDRIQTDWDGMSSAEFTSADRHIHAAFGDPVESDENPEKGKLKFRKKLVMIQEFLLVTHDKAKASLIKNQGNISDIYDRDPQYLINVYNHTEKVALFMRDFEDFMTHFMNAIHLFTVATVYDGRLLIFAENGQPIITTEETLEMLNEIERFINKSKVYRVHSQNAIYRTI